MSILKNIVDTITQRICVVTISYGKGSEDPTAPVTMRQLTFTISIAKIVLSSAFIICLLETDFNRLPFPRIRLANVLSRFSFSRA
jgi:hypothetical protein